MEAASAPRPHGLRLAKPRRFLAALSDERLVEHVRHGDKAAFEVLYDRYSAGILGFCRHMLRSEADAEDAVQHTFMAAHADIQRHDRRDLHVKAWLYTIARNRCLSMLRARREQLADDDIEIVSDGFAADVQQREDLRALLGDVQKLPDDQREALVLAELGDLSHEQISDVLGCEASKVKSLVFQARSALIDRRIARDTPCEQIREEIANLRGGALRRSYLRHHIESCPGCAEYREQVRRQRAMLAVALPVIPSAALRAHVLGSVGLGGSTAAAGTGAAATGATATGLAAQGGLVAKLGVAAALAAAGAGTAAVAHNGGLPLLHHNSPTAHTSSAAHGGSGAAHVRNASASSPGRVGSATLSSANVGHTSHRSASGTEHGFTPTQGGSNGAAARAFAQTRGKGKHSGLTKQHTKGHAHKNAHVKHAHKKAHVKHVATPPQHLTTTHVAPAPKTTAPRSTTTRPKTTTPKTHTSPTPTATTPTPTSTAPAPTTTSTVPTVPSTGKGTGGHTNGKNSLSTVTSG